MAPILNLYKPPGISPLHLITKLKENNSLYKNSVLGYAGRLDPMADGVLLVLVDEENKKRKEYERLPKHYTCTVLFGIETDTYDLLGLITRIQQPKTIMKETIQQIIPHFIGSWDQPYPPYSSPRVNGKPLFYWAREGKLDTITIPTKSITVTSLRFHSIESIPLITLADEIQSRIQSIQGEFRQKEILATWKKILDLHSQLNVITATFYVECSSGTYIRSIAHEMGKKLEVGALAYTITRTAVGEYNLATAIRV